MKTFLILVSLSLSFATFGHEGGDKSSKTKAKATCTGSKSCRACKNCKYCGHCAKNGGSCGVCSR